MKKNNKSENALLRKKAEKLLHKKNLSVNSKLSESEIIKLSHELEVYQIELEMQNEELKFARNQLTDISERFNELYDFTQSGYFILSKEGKIIDLNLSGSQMLEKNRRQLINSNFSFFVNEATRPTYNVFIKRIFNNNQKETCELTLFKTKNIPINVLVTGMITNNKVQCLIAMTDITRRKQMEVEIRLQSKIMEHLAEGVFLNKYSDGVIVYANPKLEQMFGYESRELIGKPAGILNSSTSKKNEETVQNIAQSIHLKGAWHGEVQTIKKDGTLCWCRANISAFDHPEYGNVWISIYDDITDRKKSEETLRESEEKYRILHENSGIGVGYYKPDGTVISFNKIAAQHLKGTHKNFNGKSIYDIFPKADAEFYHNRIKAAILSEKPNVYEDLIPLPIGNKYFISTISKILDLNNQISGIQIISQDITELKQVEKALRESEKTLKQIINAMPIGLWLYDKNKSIIGGNEAAHKIWAGTKYFKTSRLNLNTDGWQRVVKPIPAVERIAKRAINNGEISIDEELEIKSLDGTHKIIYISANPLFNEQQEITGAIIINQEITRRKQAEEMLRNSEETFKTLFNSGNDAIFVHYLDENGLPGRFINVNKAACKRYGYSKEEILQISPSQLDDPLITDKERLMIVKTLQENGNAKFESIHLTKTGKKIPVEVNAEIFSLQGKKVVMSIARDITDRKMAVKALRESEEKYHNLYRFAAQGIFHSTLDGKFIDVNPAFVKMFGSSSPTELIDVIKNIYEQIIHNSPQINLINIELAKSGGFVCSENQYHRKDGNLWYGILNMRIVPGHEEIPSHFEGFIEDITERKLADEVLRESEKKHRTILQTAMDGFWMVNMQGRLLEVNDAYSRMSGYSKQELLTMSISDLEYKESYSDTQKHLQILMIQKQDRFETRHVRKDGSIFDVEISAQYYPDDGGRCVSFLHDITERKLASEKLIISKEKVEESERYLVEAQKTAHIGHWNWDLTKMQLTWSDEIMNILGVEKDTNILSVENIEKIIHPDDLSLFKQKRQNILNEITELEFIYRIIRPDGEIRFIQECSKILRNEKNEPISVFGTAHDITVRKKLEDELRILSRAIEQSPSSVIITNTRGNIEYVNPKFTKVTGYSFAEVIGKNPHILKSGYSTDEVYKNLWKTIKSGKEWSGEFHNRKKNGESYWESVLISPILNEKGEITHYVSVNEDITEDKETEMKIQSSIIEAEERERMHFSQELHDGIGPLLSATKMYVDWLKMPEAKLGQAEIIKDIEKFIDESSRTIREISFKLSPHILQNYGLIEAIKAYTEKIKETSNVSIEIKTRQINRFDKNLETIAYRVLCECLNNTLKHANACEIIIDLSCKNDILFVEYSDNGSGFDISEVISQHNSIGLLNMQNRLRLINGKMDINSTPGKGTSIKFQMKIRNN